MVKLPSNWKFESEQHKKDTVASIQAIKPFLKKYLEHLDSKLNEIEKKIESRELIQENNWKDTLATLLGEKRAIKKEYEFLKKFLTNE